MASTLRPSTGSRLSAAATCYSGDATQRTGVDIRIGRQLLQTVAKRAARAARFEFSGQTLYGAIVVLVRVAVVGEAVAWLRVINRSPSPEMTYCRSMTVSVTLY